MVPELDTAPRAEVVPLGPVELTATGDQGGVLEATLDIGSVEVPLPSGLLVEDAEYQWRESEIYAMDAASGEVVRDMTPGEWPSPTFSLGGDRGYAFSAETALSGV